MTEPATAYPRRPPDGRKGQFGRVVVAGGSDVYAGAPAFNALAALRAGADLAVVVAPRRAADIVAGYAPDLITMPCETPHPDPARVADAAGPADALVVGGGVERTMAAHEAIRRIVQASVVPMVLDAEALRAVAKRPDVLRGTTAVLTPHAGEFEALAGAPWPAEEGARRDAAAALAREYGATVLVKGARDVVSDGRRVHVDDAGSPYMTKGGWGDLVAGVTGALLARNVAPYEAACEAARIVGLAGARAADEFGEGTFASDALPWIPKVIPRE